MAKLLTRKLAKPTPPAMQAMVDEAVQILNPDPRFPRPTVSVINRATDGALGRCITDFKWIPDFGTAVDYSKIVIQQGATTDPVTCRRVLVHEACHHIVACELVTGLSPSQATENVKAEGEHGPKFLEVSARANAHYGADFVMKGSDETFIRVTKEVTLFTGNDDRGRQVYSWAIGTPAKALDLLSECLANPWVGRTNNPLLVRQDTKFPAWAFPTAGSPVSVLLTQMVKGPSLLGTVTPDAPKAKKWTLIMALNDMRTTTWINAWAFDRPIKAQEIEIIKNSRLRAQLRYLLMTGDAGLKGKLPVIKDLAQVAHSYGMPMNMSINQEDTQATLAELWPKGIGGARSASLLRRKADGWDADTNRQIHREDDYQTKQIRTGMREVFNRLLSGLYVQPGGQNMTLRRFLTYEPVSELFTGTDRSVRMMGNRLRTELNDFLRQNYTQEQVNRFVQAYGSNVTDWIVNRVVARKAVLLTRRSKLSPPK